MTVKTKTSRKSEEGRTKQTVTYLTPAEREKVEEAAEKQWSSLSDYIRRVLLSEIEGEAA